MHAHRLRSRLLSFLSSFIALLRRSSLCCVAAGNAACSDLARGGCAAKNPNTHAQEHAQADRRRVEKEAQAAAERARGQVQALESELSARRAQVAELRSDLQARPL